VSGEVVILPAMSIVIVGSIGIDFVSVSPHLPEKGETVLASRDLYVGPGGKGFNQAAGAARLGGDVIFYTKTGSGDLGRQARSFLESEHLLGPSVRESLRPNQVALILVDEDGSNIISVASGASADLMPSDVADLKIGAGDIFLAQLETPIPTAIAAMERASEAGATVVLNPAPAVQLPAQLLRLVDIATPNETELAILTGMNTGSVDEIAAAGTRLLEMGVGEVIATVGSQGAMHVASSGAELHPTIPVKAIDTTGAGDAFNAGLVVGLSRGYTVDEAIALGNRAGAFCATRLGVRDGLATQVELDELVAATGG
jgi:ribokinase